MALDDCCGYCEKYREGAITPQKRMEIETWRQAVNHSKYDGSMKKSITIPIDFRYSPPGYPADEPGFRRIKVTGDLKKNLRKLNLEHQGGLRKNARKPVNGVDFHRLTTDVASMSMDYGAERRHLTPSNVDELPSTWRQNWSDRVTGGATSPASPRLKSGRGYRVVGTVHNKIKLMDEKQAVNDKQKLNRNDTKTSSVSSRGSTNSLSTESANDKNEYRTCSNDLLNVISIDDFRMRHKKFHQPIREDSEASLLHSSKRGQRLGQQEAKVIPQGQQLPEATDRVPLPRGAIFSPTVPDRWRDRPNRGTIPNYKTWTTTMSTDPMRR